MSDELNKLRKSIEKSKRITEANRKVAEELAKKEAEALKIEKVERIQTEEPPRSE